MHGTFDHVGARRAAEEIDAVAIVIAAHGGPRRRIDPAVAAVLGLLVGALVLGLGVLVA